MSEHDGTVDENTVRLSGRVTGVGESLTLPSGDVVQTIRVTVRRAGRSGERPGVDAIDVACWSAATRRTAARIEVGDRVVVDGTLRRRFFRVGVAAASRYEVEAQRLRRERRVRSGRAGGPP